MKQIHLRVTYRDDGSPFAAFLCLPSKPNEKRAKCRCVEPGMILDINQEGKLIGSELLAPRQITLEAVNAVLEEYGLKPLDRATLEPILAA